MRSRRGPLARAGQSVERSVSAIVNGIDHWNKDPLDVVEPEPYEVVFRRDRLVLRSYRPEAPESAALGTEELALSPTPIGLPVLLIPPLMIRPLVYDLREGHSLVGTLRRAGLHPYIVDFGNPDGEADQKLTLDTYILDWLPAVVEAMKADSGRADYALLGYCMGGLMAFMLAARLPDPDLRGIVSIGAPVDSGKMGLLSLVSRVAQRPIDAVASRVGNIPGGISSTAFKAMSPLRSLSRKTDLLFNLWDDEWVTGHESLEAWVGNFLDYPRDAFRQFFRDFMKENRLLGGTFEIGGEMLDLGRIRCPVLAFAGVDDKVVPVAAARAALGALGSRDVRFREVPGGHMGVVAGLRAKKAVWEPTRAFLVQVAGPS